MSRAAAVVALLGVLVAGPASAGHVNVITIDGSINPASANHIMTAIDQSVAEGAVALVIELDTPGGLLASTKDIVQSMLNARLPVAVYVSPRGGWAASAGAFITLAGHVAAMAPGTSIGAASPIGGDGSGERDEETGKRKSVAEEKAEKFTVAFIESIAKERDRNVEWAAKAVREAEAITADEALELGVIDMVADDLDELIEKMNGLEVKVDGEEATIDVANAEVRRIEWTVLTRLFNFLADPNVAGLLVLGGLLGLYAEFNNPGMILPGVAGAVCLVLAAIAFQILPFDWVGLLLMLAGLGLFFAEIFVTSYGLLFALGVGCFLLGGTMLFDVPEESDLTISFWQVLVPSVAGFALAAGAVVYAVGRTIGRKQVVGVNELVGMVGKSETLLAPEGRVWVRGEYWTASADEEIPAGRPVEVVSVHGMRLKVRPAKQS